MVLWKTILSTSKNEKPKRNFISRYVIVYGKSVDSCTALPYTTKTEFLKGKVQKGETEGIRM